MFFNLLFFILGLVFGSFFSAVTYRFLNDISWTKGRSMCPKCKKQINWYDNIPLFSFVLLGGKCRNCKNKISIRYPIIELTTGLGFLFLLKINFYNPIYLVYSLLVFSILVLIFVIDFEAMIIPDSLVFWGIFISLFYIFINDNSLFLQYIFSGLGASFLLLLINIATRGRGMGLGDVKFAVWGGILVGPKLNLIWLFLAFLTGGITGIILILGKRAGLKDQISFGPFLILAIGLALLFGNAISKYFII